MICMVLLVLRFFESSSQVITDSVRVENHYRTFHFTKPAGKTKGYNLVFILHGSGGDGKLMMQPAAGLEKKSGEQPLFLVYPNGYKKYWNECRKAATSEANLQNINEEAFFDGMIRYFAERYGVNGRHFFAIGMSGGGHMTYKLALTMPGKCKGISAIVANLPDSTNLDCAQAKKPVAVMIVNGTHDAVNPYNGGQMRVNGSSYGGVLSTDSTFGYWAGLAGYKGQPRVEELPNADTADEETITRFTYKGKGKPEVTLLKVTGGKHFFPKDIDAFVESWNFFKRQL